MKTLLYVILTLIAIAIADRIFPSWDEQINSEVCWSMIREGEYVPDQDTEGICKKYYEDFQSGR